MDLFLSIFTTILLVNFIEGVVISVELNTVEAINGSTVEIACSSNSTIVNWYLLDDNFLDGSDQRDVQCALGIYCSPSSLSISNKIYNFTTTSTQTTGQIQAVSITDDKWWHCATNGDITDSKSFQLSVIVPVAGVSISSSSNLYLTQDETYRITCNTSYCKPAADISLLKSVNGITSTLSNNITQSYNDSGNGKTYGIYDYKANTDDNGANFTCQARNSQSQSAVTSEGLIFRVSGRFTTQTTLSYGYLNTVANTIKPDNKDQPLEIILPVSLGGLLIIICATLLTYYWLKKKGRRMMSTVSTPSGSTDRSQEMREKNVSVPAEPASNSNGNLSSSDVDTRNLFTQRPDANGPHQSELTSTMQSELIDSGGVPIVQQLPGDRNPMPDIGKKSKRTTQRDNAHSSRQNRGLSAIVDLNFDLNYGISAEMTKRNQEYEHDIGGPSATSPFPRKLPPVPEPDKPDTEKPNEQNMTESSESNKRKSKKKKKRQSEPDSISHRQDTVYR